MKRIFYIDGLFGDIKKYVLKKEYKNFGIYEEVCPTGYRVHQSWLITDEKIIIVCYSYNNFCYEEILDMIDYYFETQSIGHKRVIKKFDKVNNKEIYIIHPNGEFFK